MGVRWACCWQNNILPLPRCTTAVEAGTGYRADPEVCLLPDRMLWSEGKLRGFLDNRSQALSQA